MAIPSEQKSYSSLREAVSRILGEPGASTVPSTATGIGTGGGPQQSSDIVLGNKPGTVSGVQNTPFEDPNTVAARQAVADAKAATAAMQAQVNSLNAPAAVTPTAVAATPAVAAPPQMISRAALYELQKQQQINQYEASKQKQIDALRATGFYRPDQLNFGATNWGDVMKPANWGKQTQYMNTSMVPNPYAKP
jgi:hypothetical protein